MSRFDRAYELIVGKGGGEGKLITDLRISFSISKDDSKNPNNSDISIYNLASSTRELFEKPDTRCLLRAGYHEESGPQDMFIGDVVFAWTKREGAELITKLELGDGAKTTRDSMVSLGYGPGAESPTILRDIARAMNVILSMPDDVPTRRWDNGISLHGPARIALDKITRGAGLSWSIQSGVLQILRAGGTNNRTVIELDADSGLLGSPERQRKGHQEAVQTTDEKTKKKRRAAADSKSWDGWRLTSLLLPSVVPGDRVKLNGKFVQGVFKVKELRHTGDSHDGDWQTELRVIDPKAAPTDKRNAKPATSTRAKQSNAGGPLPLPPPPAPPPP